MTTDFVFKKAFFCALVALLCCIFSFSIGYSAFLTRAVSIPLHKSFYFLVSASTHIQASTYMVSMYGGSGYILTEDDREYVVYSVYLNEQDAITVQANLSDETDLKVYSIDNVYLRNKKSMYDIKATFDIFYNWITIVDYEIARLSHGGTQQSSQHTLQLLKKQMEYCSKAQPQNFSTVCQVGVEILDEITNDVIYVTDLRYLLCALCLEYYHFANYFSI